VLLPSSSKVLQSLWLLQVDDNGNIVDAKFKTFGCGSAIASSSVATEWVRGKTLDEALTIKNSDIAKHLSLPPVKLHCSMLAEDAIKAAVDDIRKRRENVASAASQLGSDQPAVASTAP
jgi:iron-sulfur cluster assembly enzyme ISCU, mitochondrial